MVGSIGLSEGDKFQMDMDTSYVGTHRKSAKMHFEYEKQL